MVRVRDTVQRRAIRSAFENTNRPLSPREVLDAARRKVDSLGIATVYRTVGTLVADGWLVQVDLPGEPPRYERSGKTHHHHFVCDECARVYEVNGCPDGIAAVVPEDFRLTRHEVVFYGVCASCAR